MPNHKLKTRCNQFAADPNSRSSPSTALTQKQRRTRVLREAVSCGSNVHNAMCSNRVGERQRNAVLRETVVAFGMTSKQLGAPPGNTGQGKASSFLATR